MTNRPRPLSVASPFAVLIALSLVFGAGNSQGATPVVHEHEHSVSASSTETPSPAELKSLGDPGAQMRRMQAIHEQMMAAKTPEERAKLMDEQMQAMQQGMAMMNAMKHPHDGMGSNGMRHDMMEKRMDMMQMMMTMMMDRQSIENPPTRK
jgi:hypothetical protein